MAMQTMGSDVIWYCCHLLVKKKLPCCGVYPTYKKFFKPSLFWSESSIIITFTRKGASNAHAFENVCKSLCFQTLTAFLLCKIFPGCFNWMSTGCLLYTVNALCKQPKEIRNTEKISKM